VGKVMRRQSDARRATLDAVDFLNEARALALFSDRRIVQIFEVRPDATSRDVRRPSARSPTRPGACGSAGLVTLANALFLIADHRKWFNRPAWAIVLIAAGLAALAVGLVLERERQRV